MTEPSAITSMAAEPVELGELSATPNLALRVVYCLARFSGSVTVSGSGHAAEQPASNESAKVSPFMDIPVASVVRSSLPIMTIPGGAFGPVRGTPAGGPVGGAVLAVAEADVAVLGAEAEGESVVTVGAGLPAACAGSGDAADGDVAGSTEIRCAGVVVPDPGLRAA
jgi:hypothetical protein